MATSTDPGYQTKIDFLSTLDEDLVRISSLINCVVYVSRVVWD